MYYVITLLSDWNNMGTPEYVLYQFTLTSGFGFVIFSISYLHVHLIPCICSSSHQRICFHIRAAHLQASHACFSRGRGAWVLSSDGGLQELLLLVWRRLRWAEPDPRPHEQHATACPRARKVLHMLLGVRPPPQREGHKEMRGYPHTRK